MTCTKIIKMLKKPYFIGISERLKKNKNFCMLAWKKGKNRPKKADQKNMHEYICKHVKMAQKYMRACMKTYMHAGIF